MKKQLLTMFVLIFVSLAALAQDNTPQPIDGTDCSNLFFQALLDENATLSVTSLPMILL